MNIRKLSAYCMAILVFAVFQSCEDEVSPIGSSVASGEVTIQVDSLVYALKAQTLETTSIDTRSTTKVVGKISVPPYGSLDCSFVSQLLPAARMALPDSITINQVDSMNMIVHIPRGSFTGDSLAPQLMKLYMLNKQLPSDIDNNFNPKGYYDPSRPLGHKSYTLSAIAEKDSAFRSNTLINVSMKMPDEMARRTFEQYRKDSTIFQWPQEFAKEFPGIYVESSFGSGCIANVSAVRSYLYYHYNVNRSVFDTTDSIYVTKSVLMKDSVGVFTTAPEVLSSNNISYTISPYLRSLVEEGKQIITTPGGFYVTFDFPTREILDIYSKQVSNLSMISDLSFSIPASNIENDYGLGKVPSLLMVKKSKLEDFFNGNNIPDNINSFSGAYSSTTGCYEFASLREYIMQFVASPSSVTDDDCEFALVPVYLVTEDVVNSWSGSSTSYVLRCVPYIGTPTMTQLHTDKANIRFTFTKQLID